MCKEWKNTNWLNHEHRVIQTYGGGPTGGYLLNHADRVWTWESSINGRRVELSSGSLLFRRNPDADNYEGAQAFQVKHS